MPISSLHNARIASLLRLDRKKVREDTGLFVVEGPHLVGEAVAAGLARTIFAVTDPGYAGVETLLVDAKVMDRLSATYAPQGILAVVARPTSGPIGARILLLDGVQDPGNVGALLRTALAFGFTTVVAENAADFYNPKTLRATQGAVFHLVLTEMPISSFLDLHPEVTVYGTTPREGMPLETFAPGEGPLALLLGNEGAGVRPALLSRTTANLTIATAGVESLNVAAAGAIAMHHLRHD